MDAPSLSRWDSEVRLLAFLAVCASVFSFLYYLRQGDVLLYGDAVAHINIARRVFDSKTPGLLQLGTVWLPLPHLLMLPFLISNEMWQRGLGGSIPSMAAYVFGVIGIFRLLRGLLSRGDHLTVGTRLAAWIAAVVYAANPNLIYMQTTAMGEPLYLALFVWSVVYFMEFVQGNAKALTNCGLCLFAACLTRYDGWFLAAVIAAAVVLRKVREQPLHWGPILKFLLIASAAPILWLAYNGIVYRNPLEFENGPYSAKAIEKRTQGAGAPGHPGSGNVYIAGLYFLKAGEVNQAENPWLQRIWVAMLLLGITGFVRAARYARDGRLWPLLLLGVPMPFYALSVAYGGVPIFIPAWWPFTHYNARYGLELLPAFAAAAGLVIDWTWTSDRWHGLLRRFGLLSVISVLLASYASVWGADPVCLREAKINMAGRNALERQLAGWLKALPPHATLLMYLGDHVGAVQQAGIPLKRVINEGNHRVWMQPEDPDGLWERALADPAAYADYILAFDGDRVWQAVQGHRFRELVEINTTGQARAILYRVR